MMNDNSILPKDGTTVDTWEIPESAYEAVEYQRFWRKTHIPMSPLSPLKHWVANAVVIHGRRCGAQTLERFMRDYHGLPWTGGTAAVITPLIDEGYIEGPPVDPCEPPPGWNWFYRPTLKALKLFDPFFKGVSAGGPIHRKIVWKVALAARLRGFYAVPDTGCSFKGKRPKRVDVFVMRPVNPILPKWVSWGCWKGEHPGRPPKYVRKLRLIEEWDRMGTLRFWDQKSVFAIEVEHKICEHRHAKRVAEKFRKCTYHFHIPFALVVDDFKDKIAALGELRKNGHADVLNDHPAEYHTHRALTRVGRVLVETPKQFGWVDRVITDYNLFASEPFDEEGNLHPEYQHRRPSREDVGVWDEIQSYLEDGDWETIMERAQEDESYRDVLRRKGYLGDDDEY